MFLKKHHHSNLLASIIQIDVSMSTIVMITSHATLMTATVALSGVRYDDMTTPGILLFVLPPVQS